MELIFVDMSNRNYNLSNFESKVIGGTELCICNLLDKLPWKHHLYNGCNASYLNTYPLSLGLNLNLIKRSSAVVFVSSLNGIREIKAVCSTPVILWIHHDIDQPSVAALSNTIIHRSIHSFMFVSEWQMHQYVKKFHIPYEKAFVLKNCISPVYENYHLDMKHKKPYIVYTSTPFRGLNRYIDIFPKIRSQFPDVELHVFSSMKLYGCSDSEYAEMFTKLQSVEGVIMHGAVPQKELMTWLQKSLIFGYPCTFRETFCLSALEAMAMGCHVVSTRLGALPETTSGFATLIDETDAFNDEFIGAIENVLTRFYSGDKSLEKDLMKQIGYVNVHYRWKDRVREFGDIIMQDAIESCGTARSLKTIRLLRQLNHNSPTLSLLEYTTSNTTVLRDVVPYESIHPKLFDFTSTQALLMPNPRKYQEEIARFCRTHWPGLTYVADNAIHKIDQSAKIKIAFLSELMFNQSSGKLIRGIVNELSSDKFEKILCIPEGSTVDHLTNDMRLHCSRLVWLKRDLTTARSQMSELGIDIIVYAELSQSAFCYLLAFSRLAPIQCVNGWGHPITSGLDTIDYYISMDGDSQEFYTEKLVAMPLTAFYYFPTIEDPICTDRYAIEFGFKIPCRTVPTYSCEYFGLDPDKRIVLCVQQPNKINGFMISICSELLARNSGIQFVFVGNHRKEVSNFATIVRSLNQGDFMGLVSISYLALDTFPWCGGITSLDCFALNKPVVTFPMNGLKDRITGILYSIMGIDSCLATNIQEYIDIVTRLLDDPQFYQTVIDSIESNKNSIFESDDTIREWEKFIRDSISSFNS